MKVIRALRVRVRVRARIVFVLFVYILRKSPMVKCSIIYIGRKCKKDMIFFFLFILLRCNLVSNFNAELMFTFLYHLFSLNSSRVKKFIKKIWKKYMNFTRCLYLWGKLTKMLPWVELGTQWFLSHFFIRNNLSTTFHSF